MSKYFATTCFLVAILSGTVHTQNISSIIFDDFISGNISNWELPIETLKTNPNLTTNDSLLLTYTNMLYGLTGYYITNHNDKATYYLTKYNNAVELLENKPTLLSWYYAYKAANIAYQIAIHPYKAPFLGKRSLDLAFMAVQTDITNPDAWIILANAKFHAPHMMGGDKKEALKFFHTATVLWQTKGKTMFNWSYINTMAWEGFVNYKLGNYSEAKAIYTKILDIATNFFWVKDELMPDVMAKLANENR